jgi:hypothetical protein
MEMVCFLLRCFFFPEEGGSSSVFTLFYTPIPDGMLVSLDEFGRDFGGFWVVWA